MTKHQTVSVVLSLLLILGDFSPLMGQEPPSANVNNLFATWTKLSLIGYSQLEIELALAHVKPETLDRVKHRLRQKVIYNLQKMHIVQELRNSTTPLDLNSILQKITTEIRFVGLENDDYMRDMIRDTFGVIPDDTS